ncbi:hypothetical protein DFH06DRAFT_1351115 [Mycena polygramma]|nr:hypothetical protein DFH06DRAFT_1351115 [Mycena polygramma]
MFKALETFIPYVKLFQHFTLLLPNMPPVPLGPQHLSQNALHPPPFVPPEALKEIYPELSDHFETVIHTNYSRLERQLKMYDESATYMVSLSPYAQLIATTPEIYTGYQNVASKIKQTHPDSSMHTASVAKLMAMCDDMQKLRKRARLAQEKATAVAMEKNREEKEAAKEAAKEEGKRPRKKPKTKTSPEEVPTSDEEGEAVSIPDDDVPMEDIDSQERRSSPEVQIIDDPIDFDQGAQVVVSGGKVVPRPGHEKAIHTIVNKVVEDNKAVEDKKSTGKAAKKKQRAEVILFPYVHLNRIDRQSPSYVQAMNVIARTVPDEAAKVASFTEPPSQKRGRANDYIDWEHGRFHYLQAKRPAPASNQVTDRAARAIQNAIGVDVPNKGLLRAEYETRSSLVAIIARLSADLGSHETLVAKHNEIILLMKNRGLSPLKELPEDEELNVSGDTPCPYAHSHISSHLPHHTVSCPVNSTPDSVDLSSLNIPTFLD